jgi:hypothetical protein
MGGDRRRIAASSPWGPAVPQGLLAASITHSTALSRHMVKKSRTDSRACSNTPVRSNRAGIGHRFRLLAMNVAVLTATALAIASSASAAATIGSERPYPLNWDPGVLEDAEGLAVSKKEAGDIYVVDMNSSQRIDQFTPDGAFVRAFGWGIVPGAATGTGNLTVGSTTVTNFSATTGSFSTGGVGGKFVTGPGIPPGTRVYLINATELVLSNAATATTTGATVTAVAGPGNIPTNEKQAVSIRATAGQFTLTFTSPKPGSSTHTTAALAWNSSAADVETALAGLPNVGAGNVAVSGGPGDGAGTSPYVVEFKGRFADTNVLRLSAEGVGLSGGSPTSEANVSTPTEGAGVVETCTTICGPPSAEEDASSSGQGFVGSKPGQFNWSDEIAVDNDPISGSYGDVYVVDQRNFRVEKYGPEGEFLLIFGGEVNKTTHGDICTALDLAEGDTCGAGVPGTGPSHFYAEEPPTEAGGFRSWANTGSNSIAVGPGGTVYVGDLGRVQKFEPDGTYVGELDLGEAEPKFVTSLAVDSDGHVFERSVVYRGGGTSVLSEVPGVREYDEFGVLLRTFDAEPGSAPSHIALGANGNLFLSEFKEANAGNPPQGSFQPFDFRAGFRVYDPEGTLIAEVTSEQVQNRETESGGSFGPSSSNPRGIAVGDTAGSFYASSSLPNGVHVAVLPLPAPGPPVVSGERVTDIQPKTATLHALVNPREFNTSYHFQFVDDAHFQSEGFSSPATQNTANLPLGLIERDDPVQAPISGLTTATEYHYRVVAESSYEGGTIVVGPDEIFETLPAVSVRHFTTEVVGPERVLLTVELNPNGSAGAYRINIGKTDAYGEGNSAGSLRISNEFEEFSAEFNHLEPNTVYHYQLEIENGYTEAEGGVLKTADRTLTTEPSAAEERSAEDCPVNGTVHGEVKSTLREETNSISLPDCRAYEQVSEVVKEGFEVFASHSLAPGGERVLYLSGGAFAGAEANELTVSYLAQRTPSGWKTMPVVRRVAPNGIEPSMTPVEGAFTPELDRWVYMESPGIDHLHQFYNATSGYLTMGKADGSFIPQASPRYELLEGEARPYYETLAQDPLYRTDDMSRFFFVTNARLLADDPRPDGYFQGSLVPASDRIYEFSGVGGPSPSMRLIAEVPPDMPTGASEFGSNGCSLNLDTTGARQNEDARLVSTDGSTIVYTGPIVNEPGTPKCGPGTPNPIAIFIHYEGQDISHQLNAVPPSQCHTGSPCETGAVTTASFVGLSSDGTKAWFTTAQPLIDSDTDATGDLYLAELEHGEVKNLVQTSLGEPSAAHPVPGSDAGILGAVRVSGDGSHLAFTATGVLTTEPNANGDSPASGAHNLYIYDAETDQIKFVAQLCSGSEQSGAVKVPNCGDASDDGSLWVTGHFAHHHAAFSADGRFLVMEARSRLTSDDTDNTADVYRYDFDTGQLVRVSFGRNGNNGNGNDDAFATEILPGSGGIGDANRLAEDFNRTMSADGAIVIFYTRAPLVSHDTNDAIDVYEWETEGHGSCMQDENNSGGCVRLVSDGVDRHGVGGAGVISASGRDITFQTQRGEDPADKDGVGDIYDARIDGGFHYTALPSPCGSPEACRPAPTTAPSTPQFGTEVNVSGGNGREGLECAKGRHKAKRHGQVRCVPNRHRKHKRGKSHRTQGR